MPSERPNPRHDVVFLNPTLSPLARPPWHPRPASLSAVKRGSQMLKIGEKGRAVIKLGITFFFARSRKKARQVE